MKGVKFWDGEGYPVAGELYLDERVVLENGTYGQGICYGIGLDFNSDPCFEVLFILNSSSLSEFSYDAYVGPVCSSKYSVANQTHLDLYYKYISY